MVLERNDNLIGIDCGASKVLLQSAKINSNRTIISKGQYYKEYLYSSHPDWDPIINLHHLMFKLMKTTTNLS